jgi:urease subunit gamma/beta
MRLTPLERDKLLVFVAGELARSRQARGLKVNLRTGSGIADGAAIFSFLIAD